MTSSNGHTMVSGAHGSSWPVPVSSAISGVRIAEFDARADSVAAATATEHVREPL